MLAALRPRRMDIHIYSHGDRHNGVLLCWYHPRVRTFIATYIAYIVRGYDCFGLIRVSEPCTLNTLAVTHRV